MNSIIPLVARILMALIFVLAGYGKIAGYEGTQAYMASAGVPGALLPLVIFAELGGGLALAAGFLTRWAALGLAVFSIVSGLLFHSNFGDQMQQILLLKNLAMAGGLLMVYVHGGGALSLDAKFFNKS